jgi:carbon monoxide dehydrogenase subunit G
MITIRVETHKHAIVQATLRSVFELLRNVEDVARMMPGVERTESVGPGRYRCVLKPQSTLGMTFQGDYVCAYRDNGRDEISWTSPEGNMKSEGTFRIAGRDHAVALSLSVVSDVELPFPRMVRVPAQKYAEYVTSRGVDVQLARIRDRLEAKVASYPQVAALAK